MLMKEAKKYDAQRLNLYQQMAAMHMEVEEKPKA
jgi:hypothetical protein